VPSSINVRAGASTSNTVHALRKDGFTKPNAVALKNAPPGFRLSGGRLEGSQDVAKAALFAPRTATGEPVRLELEGEAIIEGRKVTHAAVPAEDMMQAFAYHHLVAAQELAVAVIPRSPPRSRVRIVGPALLRIPAGASARVRLATPDGFAQRFHFALSDPPDGITLESAAAVEGGMELTITSDDDWVSPGHRGSLTISVVPGKAPGPPPSAPSPADKRRPSPESLPPIPFEIVAQ
jgi:hypothetical protein